MTQTIECLIKRPGGSIIELDDSKYHFKPNGDGYHVCDVPNEGHAAILLAIDTAYRPYALDSNADAGHGNGDAVDLTGAIIKTDDTDDTDDGEGETGDKAKEKPLDEAAERERLAALYQERFGKKPHHMMGVKRIREELGIDE